MTNDMLYPEDTPVRVAFEALYLGQSVARPDTALVILSGQDKRLVYRFMVPSSALKPLADSQSLTRDRIAATIDAFVQSRNGLPVHDRAWLSSMAAAIDNTTLRLGSLTGVQDSLHALLELHTPWAVTRECGHTHPAGDPAILHEDDEVGRVCKDGVVYHACRACCTSEYGGSRWHTQDCADGVTGHDHEKDGHCPRVIGVLLTHGVTIP